MKFIEIEDQIINVAAIARVKPVGNTGTAEVVFIDSEDYLILTAESFAELKALLTGKEAASPEAEKAFVAEVAERRAAKGGSKEAA